MRKLVHSDSPRTLLRLDILIWQGSQPKKVQEKSERSLSDLGRGTVKTSKEPCQQLITWNLPCPWAFCSHQLQLALSSLGCSQTGIVPQGTVWLNTLSKGLPMLTEWCQWQMRVGPSAPQMITGERRKGLVLAAQRESKGKHCPYKQHLMPLDSPLQPHCSTQDCLLLWTPHTTVTFWGLARRHSWCLAWKIW